MDRLFNALRSAVQITTAIFSFLVFSLASAQPIAPPKHELVIPSETPQTLEGLGKAIADGTGRTVYDAFNAIPKKADTSEKQQEAFALVFPYLLSDKRCVVDGYYPPGHQVTSRTLPYGRMAADCIVRLGVSASRGLMKGLASEQTNLALRCAVLLCEMQGAALHLKGGPGEEDYPLLEPSTRGALERFLQDRGHSLDVTALTRFYRAGLPAAAGYIHGILKTTKDAGEKHTAVIYLGSYGYAPALDDLLEIFRNAKDPNLRLSVRECFQYFADSDRVTEALKEIRENASDESLRKECDRALELVRIKAEWRRQYGMQRTNDWFQPPVPPVPKKP